MHIVAWFLSCFFNFTMYSTSFNKAVFQEIIIKRYTITLSPISLLQTENNYKIKGL